ncbi:Spindle and kinetochore-associated 2 [Rhynchospora pubera]|uniref:Protein FAM33A n=1 Tax=Rhynchospora pubera TaxID=906938 RepID=A0AAV8CHR4_9POAL|nr:Spindle and kinetochore-associated 2 [Rhynchospora pubera]
MVDRGQNERLHPVISDLMVVLSKANNDLTNVQHRLQIDFQQSYPDHVNPCKLVARVKKIQEELEALKELSRELLAEKQDLIDKARASLVGQKVSLQRLLASWGLPPISESDEGTYANLNKIISEWTSQVRAKKKDGEDSDSEDINKMLFSAIVRDN